MTSSEFWWVKVKLQSIELESGKNLLLVANSKLAALVDKLKATPGGVHECLSADMKKQLSC